MRLLPALGNFQKPPLYASFSLPSLTFSITVSASISFSSPSPSNLSSASSNPCRSSTQDALLSLRCSNRVDRSPVVLFLSQTRPTPYSQRRGTAQSLIPPVDPFLLPTPCRQHITYHNPPPVLTRPERDHSSEKPLLQFYRAFGRKILNRILLSHPQSTSSMRPRQSTPARRCTVQVRHVLHRVLVDLQTTLHPLENARAACTARSADSVGGLRLRQLFA